MKTLIALAIVLTVCVSASFVQAKGKSGKSAQGVKGTVASVGTQGFAITTEDGKTIDVLCNANTKFVSSKDKGSDNASNTDKTTDKTSDKPADTNKASASDIKVGVDVAVQGGMNGTQVIATQVTIVSSGKKKS